MSRPTSELRSAATVVQADDYEEFRLAQVLLLLQIATEEEIELDVDRIAAFDFLAANPFLLVEENDGAYERLSLAGFGVHSISYAAPGHRFATRRGRILHDLSLLVAYGLIRVERGRKRRYVVAPRGIALAQSLVSSYADAYRQSAYIVMRRMQKLSDKQLRDRMSTLLHGDPLLFELLDHRLGSSVDEATGTRDVDY